MTTSKIEWTEQVWNPIVGCTVHSAGCTNCYAMRMADRLQAMAEAGNTALDHYRGTVRKVNGNPVWTGKLGFSEAALLAPLRRKKPTRWFVNSMSDLFHQDVPDEWIDRVFAVMALAPQHTFQVLTKRTARMRQFFRENTGWRARIAALLNDLKPSPLWNGNVYQGWQNLHGRPDGLPNVWLGASVEDQRAADERVPDLLATPAAVHWLSCEPLLGPVDLTTLDLQGFTYNALTGEMEETGRFERLDWIVTGGESGPGARPMHPDWARSLRDQCAAAGVPFFFKQWGEWAPVYDRERTDPDWRRCGEIERMYPGGRWLNLAGGHGFHGEMLNYVIRSGKKAAGRTLDGALHDAMPAPLA